MSGARQGRLIPAGADNAPCQKAQTPNRGLPMSDEPDDNDLLTEKQLAALQAARRALVDTIARLMGGDHHQVLQLVFIAVSGLFADMLALSASDSKLVDVVNQQLAEAGWRVVPVLRH
jgi:hypothetical protein